MASPITPPTGWESVENPKEIQECVDLFIAHWPAQHQTLTLRKCLMKMYVEPGRHRCLYMFRSSDWDTNQAQRVAASFYLRRIPREDLAPWQHGWCLCVATLMTTSTDLQLVYARLDSLSGWFRSIGGLQEIAQDPARVLPTNLQSLFNTAATNNRLNSAADDTEGRGWPNPLKRWTVNFPTPPSP